MAKAKKNEQVDQLAEDIEFNRQILPNPKESEHHQLARLLVEDGYGKVSDVVNEIFEALKATLDYIPYSVLEVIKKYL